MAKRRRTLKDYYGAKKRRSSRSTRSRSKKYRPNRRTYRRSYRRKYRMSRKYTSDYYLKVQTQETAVAIPSDLEVRLAAYFDWQFLANTDVIDQVKPLLLMFDLVKCRKSKLTWWITDNDQITTAETLVRCAYSYDPDMSGRTMDFKDILNMPDHKHILMKVGRKYKLIHTPKWAVLDKNGNRLYGFNRWRDCSEVAAFKSDDPCENGYNATVKGPADSQGITYRMTFYLQFKKRNQGAFYHGPASDTPAFRRGEVKDRVQRDTRDDNQIHNNTNDPR